MENETGSARERSNGHAKRMVEQSRQARNEAQAFVRSVEGVVGEMDGFIRDQAEVRPYAVLGAAAGIGYLLGGGLRSRLTGLLVTFGARAALNYVLSQVVQAGSHQKSEDEEESSY